MDRDLGIKRNGAIDVYRVALMAGIVLLHIVGQQQFWAEWRHLAFLLLSCVDGFILITGYFGVSFKWRKVVLLYITMAYCLLVSAMFVDAGRLGFMVKAFKEYWFLHSYAFLLCCAPLVNLVFEERSHESNYALRSRF